MAESSKVPTPPPPPAPKPPKNGWMSRFMDALGNAIGNAKFGG